jgi:hypothetical protein
MLAWMSQAQLVTMAPAITLLPRPQPNLYEFFMNFLDQFYARPFLIKDGLECFFGEALCKTSFGYWSQSCFSA